MINPLQHAPEDLLKVSHEKVSRLLATLREEKTYRGKIEKLELYSPLRLSLEKVPELAKYVISLSSLRHYVVKAALAIEQENLFAFPTSWLALIDALVAVEKLYDPIGGIVGYQCLTLERLIDRSTKCAKQTCSLRVPPRLDITTPTPAVRKAILSGIRSQGQLGEMYPVGGAADRLQLIDHLTQETLPAARLVFLGNHLLEGVIRDLQAREYLSFQLFGKQVITPIAMMTSNVQGNTEHIEAICAENRWFGRPKSSFRFFKQPLVPTFTEEGKWCLAAPGQLLLRPSGHGVLWTLADREGVFAWLRSLGKKKILIRQINNPMAAIDNGLLAFLGMGWSQNKLFGFVSCPRMAQAQEGVNVVKVFPKGDGEQVVLTNIEYCDFEQFGLSLQEEFSALLPSNANILFADISSVAEAAKKMPFPGLLVNFRKMKYFDGKREKEGKVARLEATMQNLAEYFVVEREKKDAAVEELSTYLTFNKRRKTISTAKRKANADGSLVETPDGCYYDFLRNAYELLETHCGACLPPFVSEANFKKDGPSFLFSYHPALGPLYSIIGQKIRGGRFAIGSELHLEIADVDLVDLTLEGSLLITATAVMGHLDGEGKLCYSHRTGQCLLHRVRVVNKGIDWSEDHLFWKHDVERLESLDIRLHGNSQFIAKDLTLRGDWKIEVPDGVRMIAEKQGERIAFRKEPMGPCKAFWKYAVDEEDHIVLSRELP